MAPRDSEALLYSAGHGRSSRDSSDEEGEFPAEEEQPRKSSWLPNRTVIVVVAILLLILGVGGAVWILKDNLDLFSSTAASEAAADDPTIATSASALATTASSAATATNDGDEKPSTTAPSATTQSGGSAMGAKSSQIELSTSSTLSGSPTSTAEVSNGSGLAVTLASSFSLTPASMPTLAFPDSAISSSSDALDFISSKWALVTGNSEYIGFVDDPFAGSSSLSSGTVLAVEYPKGSYAGDGPEGGVMGAILNVFGDNSRVQRAMLSYEVAFSENFGWVKGGKLPGLFGGNHEDHGCSGGEQSDRCFSLRLMWRAEGAGEVYAYIPRYDGFCDDEMECNETYGISVNRGSWTFTAGAWNTVTEVAILNSDPGTSSTANGMLSMYIGGSDEPVFTRSNVVFRTNSDVTFTAIFLTSFFGGSSESFASEGGTAYFRNFQIYAGEDPSSSSGKSVSASVPS